MAPALAVESCWPKTIFASPMKARASRRRAAGAGNVAGERRIPRKPRVELQERVDRFVSSEIGPAVEWRVLVSFFVMDGRGLSRPSTSSDLSITARTPRSFQV